MIKRLSFLSLLLFVFSTTFAQQTVQDQSWTVLSNSAGMIQFAQKGWKSNETKMASYRTKGDLAKAVNHYHYAVQLHQAGNYYTAIHHARRARFLAAMVVRWSGMTLSVAEAKPDGIIISDMAPADNVLDSNMEASLVDKVNTDDEAVNAEIR